MRFAKLILGIVMFAVSGTVLAQSTIFNIEQPAQSQVTAPNDTMPTAVPQNYIRLPQVQKSQNIIAPPNAADQKTLPQYERFTNESNDAYLNRLNSMAKKSADDLERISRDHIDRMKAMAPK